MKSTLPRMVVAGNVPGADKFNKWIDTIVSAVENLSNISIEGPGSVTAGANGILIKISELPISLVRTTGTISARSGTTPGSGTVTFLMYNQSVFVDNSARTNVTVYNYSSNTTLTVSGKYGVCIKWFGVWWLIVVEC